MSDNVNRIIQKARIGEERADRLLEEMAVMQQQIDRLNAQLAEARDRGLEDAAVWHDYQVSDLEEQIKRNDEYRTRTGNLSAASEANDFCRSLQSNHRISATSIRALKGKT